MTAPWKLAALFMLPGIALAQPYPSKPIRLIVTFATGGGTDLVARTVAPRLAEALGQPIVIENRAGANGAIGVEAVARAAPDGYTLAVGAAGTLVVAPHLGQKLPFDTFKDLTPVALMVTSPFIVTVNPAVKAKSVAELIALAKSGARLNVGSSGVGGAPHLAAEFFKSLAGVEMEHVAYKGLGPAITDLLGGQIQVIFADVGLVSGHIKSGRLSGLAVTGATRSSAVPELPTVAEAGLAGYAAGTWYGVLAPAGTPATIVARLNEEIRRVQALPEVRNALVAQGVEPALTTPEQFGGFMRDENAKWSRVIRNAGIKLEP